MRTISRKQVSFRLREDLLISLKDGARRANISLNTFVESILIDAVNFKPNEETISAINEAHISREKKLFDSVESLMDELRK